MEKNKVIDIDVSTKGKLAFFYVLIWNGMLSLRDSEAKLLVKLLERYLEYETVYPTKEDRFEKLFSPRVRKEIREKLGISEAVFNQRFMYLKKKNVILQTGNGLYSIDDRFIPTKEIMFKFNINQQ